MMRLVILLAWLVCLWPPGVRAQPPVSSGAISAEQARAALDVLNDPAKRAAFAATLNALIKAEPARPAANGAAPPAAAATAATDAAAAAPSPAEALKIPLAPDSLGAQVLVSASGFVSRLGAEAMAALDAAQSLPLLYGWAFVMATNPVARDLLSDVVWRLALAIACAAAVEFGLRRAMRRPIRSLEAIAPAEHPPDQDDPLAQPGPPDAAVARAVAGESEPSVKAKPALSAWLLLRRVPLALARLVLELVPVLGIIVTGHLIAGSSLGGHAVSELIILAVIDAYAICIAILCIARMLLSPGTARLRLFHLSDAAAAYLIQWTRRLVLVAVFGYALGEVGLLLGLSNQAHDLLQKSVGLVLFVTLSAIVLHKRRAVRGLLRAPQGQTGFAAGLRNRFAAVWHWAALFFLASVWLVWAVEVPHGYAILLHYVVITALVLIGARFAIVVLQGSVDRAMRPAPGGGKVTPAIHVRLRAYYPAVAASLRFAIWVLCGLGLLQLYGMDSFLWLTTSYLGLRILNAAATIILTIVVAFLVWEGANASVENHLERLRREAQMARSARLRTLLPLLRTTLLISIAIFAGLTVLSEIGINVAPLLAGAGIIGVAIGFGSQKLVQDLINGIFLLLENAMQVGDFVTVSGLSGTVEALSVRAIRLRATDGSVHLIPFSNVTSVTNVNRGLGNASVNVTVDYNEDTDRVAAELKAIVTGMRGESQLSAMMLSDLQLWGVDKVDGAGVTMAGQIVCTDSGRWPVQREFNRRMKRRFQELGIRIFNPVQTIEVSAVIPINAPADRLLEQGADHGRSAAAD